MFNQEELQNKIKNPVEIKEFFIEETVFGQDDFKVPEAEEQIIFYRGSKADFADSTDFYVASLVKETSRQGEYKFYPVSAKGFDFSADLFKKVSAEDYINFVREYSSSLKVKFDFEPKDKLIAAMIMREDWDDVEILGETENDYYVFSWLTTA